MGQIYTPLQTGLFIPLCAMLVHASFPTDVNIASLASLTVSSTLSFEAYNFSKYNIYDGRQPNHPNDTDICNCCFSSGKESAPFLEAVFHGHFDIHRIVLWARRDDHGASSDFSGISVLLDNIPAPVIISDNNQKATIYPALSTVKRIAIERPNKVGWKWYLMICEMEVFAKAINVATIANVSVSSIKEGHTENAVDNTIRFRGLYHKDVCYSSNKEVNPYFEGEFQHPMHIRLIVIDGGLGPLSDRYDRSSVTVYIDNQSVPVSLESSRNVLSVVPSSPVQVFKIERKDNPANKLALVICELGIFVADCSLGFYGDTCTQACGNCDRSGVCDWTGTCIYGCSAGYQGKACNESCPYNRYSINCSKTCNCKNKEMCDKVTGKCPDGCDFGWMGDGCSAACESGTFGLGCSNTCHCLNNQTCDIFTGQCPGQCDRGWTGGNCSLSCSSDRYGPDCMYQCHCTNYGVCDRASGICSSCAIGWTGLNCSTVCPDGSFGAGCRYFCHCKNNLVCDKVTGICPDDCAPGWSGQTCSTGFTFKNVVEVNCSSSIWDVKLNITELRQMYPTAVASDVYFGHNSCTGIEESGLIRFQYLLENCLTSRTVNKESTVYSNELVYAQHDIKHPFLIRSFNWTLPFECVIDKLGNTHGNLKNSTDVGKASTRNYTVDLMFYQDPNYMMEIVGQPLNVPVGTTVYVKVFTTVADWGMKMRVDTCYTKPDVDAQDHLKIEIIKHGCELDYNTHIISQSAHETRFTYQQFAYTMSHEGIFMFCDAVFCNVNDVSDRCSQPCRPNA